MSDEEIYELIRDGDYCMPPVPTGKEMLSFARAIEAKVIAQYKEDAERLLGALIDPEFIVGNAEGNFIDTHTGWYKCSESEWKLVCAAVRAARALPHSQILP